MHLGQHRLRIEGIHLRRSAIGEDVDDVFCLPAKLGRAGLQRIAPGLRGATQHRLESHGSQPHAAALQKVAPGGKQVGKIGGVVGFHNSR